MVLRRKLGSAGACKEATVARMIETKIIYKNPHSYSSWPCIEKLRTGDIVVAFCESMRRIPYTHGDCSSHNVIVRSRDGGRTWNTAPRQVYSYAYTSMEVPDIKELSNGDVLLIAYRNVAIPEEMAGLPGYEGFWPRGRGFPWALKYLPDQTFVFRSKDGAHTWGEPVRIDVSPHFLQGYSFRPMVEISPGELIFACGDEQCLELKIAPSKQFAVKSTDNGATWKVLSTIAADPTINFYECSLLGLSGKIIAMIRTHEEGDHHLFQSVSRDGGSTWSKPKKTPIWGYPAHMLRLRDGPVLCTYGYRKEPFGIRACLSRDEGETWDVENEIVIRDDFPNSNLGYPTSIQLEDGSILCSYYGEDRDGVTCIQSTRFSL
jgi:sialidase-1